MYSNKICTHIIYWILYMQQYICINIGNVAVSMYTVDVQAFRLNKTKLRYRSKNFWETAIKYVFTFFTTFFFHIHKKKEFDSRKFSATFFLMNLHALRSPEHDLTIFRKCPSVCLYYFVDTVSQELMGGNWWKFTFSCTLI